MAKDRRSRFPPRSCTSRFRFLYRQRLRGCHITECPTSLSNKLTTPDKHASCWNRTAFSVHPFPVMRRQLSTSPLAIRSLSSNEEWDWHGVCLAPVKGLPNHLTTINLVRPSKG